MLANELAELVAPRSKNMGEKPSEFLCLMMRYHWGT
jgi:hypothetical protein